MESDPDRTFRELGFYLGTAGSYYKLVPPYLAVHPLSNGQWAIFVGSTTPATEAVVFPTAEAAAVWLTVEGLCQGVSVRGDV